MEADDVADVLDTDTIDKYRNAADVVNRVMAQIVAESTPGKKVVDLCAAGDNLITEALGSIFNKTKVEKGLAFPTCISVNNCVGHFSPLASDATVLQEGDLVKLDMGAQIDGYIVNAAHSFIATANLQEPVSGRKADVICAAHFASECALRLFRPGKTNAEVTKAIQKVAEAFHCNPVEGVLSHQLRRYVIDGNNVVINKETADQQVDEVTFEEGDVYCFDIVMSTGEGKPKESETRTTIYKRAVEQSYNLKMKASRALFSEINSKFPTYPFSLRALGDEKRSRLGVTECLKHQLLDPYPVLYEKEGEYVAQFKFTVLITANQTTRLTSHPLPFVTSSYQIADPEILQLLSLGTKRGAKKKKKNRKKKKGGAQQQQQQGQGEEGEEAEEEEGTTAAQE